MDENSRKISCRLWKILKSSVLSPKSLKKNQEEDLESYDSDDEEEEGLLHRFAPFLTESRSEDLGGPGLGPGF